VHTERHRRFVPLTAALALAAIVAGTAVGLMPDDAHAAGHEHTHGDPMEMSGSIDEVAP
jgi:hypothetical protein